MSVSRFWVCTTCSEAVVVAVRQIRNQTEHLAQCSSCHWEVQLFLAAWARKVIAFPDGVEDTPAAQEQGQQMGLISNPPGRPRRSHSRKKV